MLDLTELSDILQNSFGLEILALTHLTTTYISVKKTCQFRPSLLLGPPHHLTIQWVREITSLDSKLPDQTTKVHIRTDLRSNTIAQRNRLQSSRSLFAQWRHRPRNVVIRDVIICKRLHFDCLCLCSTTTLR